MLGDATLFTRSDEIEEQWALVDAIVAALAARPGRLPELRGRNLGAAVVRRAAAPRRPLVAAALMADGRTDRARSGAASTSRSRQIEPSSPACGASRSATTAQPHQRTSVMTHIAWVPPEWVEAAERTLEGLGERHPSRTVILVAEPGRARRDRRASSRSARSRSATAPSASEVIELTLRGDRSLRAGVGRPAARDLRPAGLPALARRAAVRRDAVGAARRRRRPGDRRLVGMGGAPLPRARGRRSSGRPSRTSRGRARTSGASRSRRAGRRSRAGDPRPRAAGRGGAAARLACLAARPRPAARPSRPASSACGSTARRSRPARATSRHAERPAERRARQARARPDLRAGGLRAGRATLTRGWSGQLVSAGGSRLGAAALGLIAVGVAPRPQSRRSTSTTRSAARSRSRTTRARP